MTTRALQWALSQITGFPEVKFVLLQLAWDADADGRGNVTLHDLAHYTEIDEAKLRSIFHTLENLDLACVNVDGHGVVRYRLKVHRP